MGLFISTCVCEALIHEPLTCPQLSGCLDLEKEREVVLAMDKVQCGNSRGNSPLSLCVCLSLSVKRHIMFSLPNVCFEAKACLEVQ